MSKRDECYPYFFEEHKILNDSLKNNSILSLEIYLLRAFVL